MTSRAVFLKKCTRLMCYNRCLVDKRLMNALPSMVNESLNITELSMIYFILIDWWIKWIKRLFLKKDFYTMKRWLNVKLMIYKLKIKRQNIYSFIRIKELLVVPMTWSSKVFVCSLIFFILGSAFRPLFNPLCVFKYRASRW